MTDYPTPSDEEEDRVRRTLAEDLITDELMAHAEGETATGRIAPSRLYAYAAGRLAVPDEEIETALAATPALRATYQRMLRSLAVYHFPAVRAASTGTAPVREVAGCRITLAEDEGQTFVVIELPEGTGVEPQHMAVFGRDGSGQRVALPEALRGIIHFPVAAEAPLLALLRDPMSEVSLT
jgi:hypothetical protein